MCQGTNGHHIYSIKELTQGVCGSAPETMQGRKSEKFYDRNKKTGSASADY